MNIKKICFWLFVILIFLSSAFIGVGFYGKHTIEKELTFKMKFSGFKLYYNSFAYSKKLYFVYIYQYDFETKTRAPYVAEYWSPFHGRIWEF